MSKIFLWKPSDSVDVALIDQQHQELFDTAQHLYDALKRADGTAVAEEVFSRLVGYSSNHFAAEEALMAKQNYPSLKSHRFEHRAFTTQLHEFQKDFQAGHKSVVTALLLYLQKWIKAHVQGADHHFAEFLKAHAQAKAQSAGQ
jgi:hemerythrin